MYPDFRWKSGDILALLPGIFRSLTAATGKYGRERRDNRSRLVLNGCCYSCSYLNPF